MAQHETPTRAPLSRREFLVVAAATLAAAHPAGAAMLRSSTPARRLGAFVNPANRRLDAVTADAVFARFETMVGRALGIRSYYVAWDEEFPAASHTADAAAGRAPLLAWYPPADLRSIPEGAWDDLIYARAAAARAYGRPLFLRFASEFNGAWSGVSGRQRDFVQAWRYLVTSFRRAHADNVRWVWCPYASERRSRADDWSTYWPGDAFVDWVGIDGYNWGTSRAWSSWQPFAEIFGPLHAYARRKRKPAMICEVASAEVGGDKAAWIRHMHAELRGRFADVRAVVWFDVDKETDWRVASSAASLAAFRALAADRALS